MEHAVLVKVHIGHRVRGNFLKDVPPGSVSVGDCAQSIRGETGASGFPHQIDFRAPLPVLYRGPGRRRDSRNIDALHWGARASSDRVQESVAETRSVKIRGRELRAVREV